MIAARGTDGILYGAGYERVRLPLGELSLCKIGDGLQLTMELQAGKSVTCELKVVHVRSPKLGARIVSMSPEDRAQLAHALDDQVQYNFSHH